MLTTVLDALGAALIVAGVMLIAASWRLER